MIRITGRRNQEAAVRGKNRTARGAPRMAKRPLQCTRGKIPKLNSAVINSGRREELTTGENETKETSSVSFGCPSKDCFKAPVMTSQSLILPSRVPYAKVRLSGEKDIGNIRPEKSSKD